MKKLLLLLFICLGVASGSTASGPARGPVDLEDNRVDIYSLGDKLKYSLGDRPPSGSHISEGPQNVYVIANDHNACYDIVEETDGDNGGRMVMDLDRLDENSAYHYSTDPFDGVPAADVPNPAPDVSGAHDTTGGGVTATANTDNMHLSGFGAYDVITDNNIPSVGTNSAVLNSFDVNSGIMDNDILPVSDSLGLGDLNTFFRGVLDIDIGEPSIAQVVPTDDVEGCCSITKFLGLNNGCCVS